MSTSPTVRAHGTRIAFLCVAHALWLWTTPARAREPADEALSALRTAIDEARFTEAARQAEALLLRTDLRASERNRGLALLAETQIAARDDAAAHATLRTLYGRDPEYPTRLGDQGPRVAAAHARARAAAMRPTVALTTMLARDAHGRPLIEVQLSAGRDAVDSVHVFVQEEGEAEPTHLVAEVGTREALALALPEPPRDARELAIYLEAHAPSGATIGRYGSAEAPLRGMLPPQEAPCVDAHPPLRRAWWLWTSVALVVAVGLGVGGAAAAH